MEKEAEEQLIRSIQQEPDRFGILFDTYYKQIFNYIYRRSGNFGASQDICSETFLKAFLNIHRFKWKGIPISFWLYRIANNELQQFLRKKKYSPESLDMLIETERGDQIYNTWPSEGSSPIEKMQKEDADFIFIREEIKKLPVLYQEVLALRYFEQKNIKDIAAILDKKEGTIKSLLSRGVRKLRNSIG